MLPAGLDTRRPGVFLDAILSGLANENLSGHDRVVVLRAYQKMVSFFQAQVYQQMAQISDLMDQIEPDPEFGFEAAAAEVRAALRLTRRAADAELALAVELKHRVPKVWDALAAGEIDLRRARVIVDGTSHLSLEAAREVVDRIIDRAPRMTTGQLGSVLRRLCVQADPADAANRYRDAVDERRILSEPTVDGTANLLGLNLPPERVAAVMSTITELAQALKRNDETRSMDQLRADVYLDLLDGRQHGNRNGKGMVDLQVDLETLAGLSENPGELAGYGPVIADIARQVVEQQKDTQWRWTVIDPGTGQPLYGGTTRRRPTAGQRRHVEARNRTCIFPGCRMPATECDLDHGIPWSQGGPTTTNQLVPLCRHDHQVRHKAGWTHQPLTNGDHQWTSPLGHTYTTSGLPP